MVDTGATGPGTAADDDAVGTLAWADTSNALSDDENYSIAAESIFSPEISHYLKLTNFSFNIPAGVTIDGIKVEIKKRSGSAGITDEHIKIIKSDGSIGSENKADTTTEWLSTAGGYYITYGGEDDLWSESWDYTDINNSNFGIAISADVPAFLAAQIFYTRITVYYTEEVVIPINSNLTLIAGGGKV